MPPGTRIALSLTVDGIAVDLVNSPSPDPGIASIGNNQGQQGTIAAERLVELIGHTGQVAIMQGYPSAPNHRQRYEAQLSVFAGYPDISGVDGGIDNDDFEAARRQAAASLTPGPHTLGC